MSRYPSPPRNVYHISSRSRATTPERHIARQALRADYQPNLYLPSAQDLWPRGPPMPPSMPHPNSKVEVRRRAVSQPRQPAPPPMPPSMPHPNPKVEVRRRAVSQPRKRVPPPLHITHVPEFLPNVQVVQMPDAPTPYPPRAAALSDSLSVELGYSDSECDARDRGRQRSRQATAPAADARRSITTPRVEAFLSSKSEADLRGLFKRLTKRFAKKGERLRRTEASLRQQLQSSAVKRNMAREPCFVPMPAKTEGTHDDIVFTTMVPDDVGGKTCFQHLPGVNLVRAADLRGGLMLVNAKATPMIGKEKDRNGYIKIWLQWPCYDESQVHYLALGPGSSIMTFSLVYHVAALTCKWFQATRKAHPRSNGTHEEWKIASKETSDGVHENHMDLHGLRHIGGEHWVPILFWNPPGIRF